jgi:hypothetical protein
MAHEKREKVYTVSERLVFSSIIVVLIVVLLLSAAAVGVIPLGQVTTTIPPSYTTTVGYTTTVSNVGTQQNPYYFGNGWQGVGYYTGIPSTTVVQPYYIANEDDYNAFNPPIVISAACSPTNTSFACRNPYFNYTTGNLTIALEQISKYNWTRVTVRFVQANVIRAESQVPELSWSPPTAVNVTGGMLNDTLHYVNIPITSGPVAVGTNITGFIWAKYQIEIGGRISYANMSSAWIVIKRGS